MSIRRWSVVTLVLLLVASAVATAPAQPAKRGGVLRIAERSDPVGFDTLGKKKASVYTQLALGYTHNRLFKYGPKGEIVPDLAASFSQPNPTTYVVALKKGVRFHGKPPVNGRELTSEDVKFTFERVAASPEARLFPTLKRVSTPDRYTVQFELSAPFSAFVANLAATTMYIYAKEAGKPLPDGARDYTSVETVVGTGPFVLDEYREKQRLVFKKNPGYFESGKPVLDGVELYIVGDASAQLAAFRTGKIDLLPASTGQGLPQFLAAEARSIPGTTIVKHALFQTSENLIGRLNAKPWSDLRVRRAASLAGAFADTAATELGPLAGGRVLGLKGGRFTRLAHGAPGGMSAAGLAAAAVSSALIGLLALGVGLLRSPAGAGIVAASGTLASLLESLLAGTPAGTRIVSQMRHGP